MSNQVKTNIKEEISELLSENNIHSKDLYTIVKLYRVVTESKSDVELIVRLYKML